MIKLIIGIFSSLLMSATVSAQVRKPVLKMDEILIVKTALGIATIIELPETVQSVLIGDQAGFKIEYLDHAVTIKPLRASAKTNLYLVTAKRRYNIRLVTLPQASADYIVYVKDSSQAQALVKWVKVGKSTSVDSYHLTIDRVGFSDSGFILIDAKLTTSSFEDTSFKAENFWITQGDTSKVINGLFLSDLKLIKNNPVVIGVSLAKSDLIAKMPITFELRVRKKISVTLSSEFLWK